MNKIKKNLFRFCIILSIVHFVIVVGMLVVVLDHYLVPDHIPMSIFYFSCIIPIIIVISCMIGIEKHDKWIVLMPSLSYIVTMMGFMIVNFISENLVFLYIFIGLGGISWFLSSIWLAAHSVFLIVIESGHK